MDWLRFFLLCLVDQKNSLADEDQPRAADGSACALETRCYCNLRGNMEGLP